MDKVNSQKYEHFMKFSKKIEKKQKRKVKARREKDKNIWFGLGMFGIVGWSVSIPILIFTALGIWIDTRWSSHLSWTLMFLFLGVLLGCINAWYWITKEQKKIEEEHKDE